MIGDPINDCSCLSKVTDVIADSVESDEVREMALRHETTRELAAWIRSLPQKNDTGESGGPHVSCDVPQRLRIPAPDPNCVERAAMYIAGAELIDPGPLRQLATIDTPVGRHTFPVEDDRPIKLDPRIPRNALEAGLFRMGAPNRVELTPRETLRWISSLAREPAGRYRNGRRRVRNAQKIFLHAARGRPVPRNAVGDIGFVLALADQAARMFGLQGTELVRLGAMALDEAARRRRNLSLRIGGMRIKPDLLLERIARVGSRLGLQIGSAALQAKLASMGIPLPILRELERELNREGLTLGALAQSPPLPGTLAAVTTEALMRRKVAASLS